MRTMDTEARLQQVVDDHLTQQSYNYINLEDSDKKAINKIIHVLVNYMADRIIQRSDFEKSVIRKSDVLKFYKNEFFEKIN